MTVPQQGTVTLSEEFGTAGFETRDFRASARRSDAAQPVHSPAGQEAPSEDLLDSAAEQSERQDQQNRRATDDGSASRAVSESDLHGLPDRESMNRASGGAEQRRDGFAALGLSDEIVQAAAAAGYCQPTEIQQQIIPHLLNGRDILGQSQTGSGKTAAFALPILSNTISDPGASRGPRTLVLTPTRELALQVAASFRDYGAERNGVSVAAVCGGRSYGDQQRQFRRGVQIVTGTPGRIIDHLKRGTLRLSDLRTLVLDEADEMLNMGFLEDVLFVLRQAPAERQVALFSATVPPAIRHMSEQWLQDPVHVTIRRRTATAESIRQRAVVVSDRDKPEVLARVLETENTDAVVVFAATKHATVSIAENLRRRGMAAVVLNGDVPQPVRERTIRQLVAGDIDILVATDVAARGLDVSRISHVINYDVPRDSESYIHRVGRTGRAGRQGEAILFLRPSQKRRLKQIERATRQPVTMMTAPTVEELNAGRLQRFREKILQTAAGEDLQFYSRLIEELTRDHDLPAVSAAAALAHLLHQGRPFLAAELPRRQERSGNAGPQQPPRRSERTSRPESASGLGSRKKGRRRPVTESNRRRYRLSVGRQQGVRPGSIVQALLHTSGLDARSIGAIRIHASWSTVELPADLPDAVIESLQAACIGGTRLCLRPDHHGATDEQERVQGDFRNRSRRKNGASTGLRQRRSRQKRTGTGRNAVRCRRRG